MEKRKAIYNTFEVSWISPCSLPEDLTGHHTLWDSESQTDLGDLQASNMADAVARQALQLYSTRSPQDLWTILSANFDERSEFVDPLFRASPVREVALQFYSLQR
jgi:hypothetical protein